MYTVLFYILKPCCLFKNNHLNYTHCLIQQVETAGTGQELEVCTGSCHLLWLLECKMLRESTIVSPMSLDFVPRTVF
jgi:hypothetical protein